MANRFYTNYTDRKISGGAKYSAPAGSGNKKTISESKVAWPGLPGKKGPDRSAGVKRVKKYAQSEGV